MSQLPNRDIERCTESSCRDRPSFFRWASKTPPPPDRGEIGRAAWKFLHTMAANFPDEPTKEEAERQARWMGAFTRLYPCHICRQGFEEIIEKMPPKVTDRANFALWMCEAHNEVNKDISLPTVECKADELLKLRTDYPTDL
uniref:Sulfhydryl oxidase n=1 Tax=Chromera velia CCMP2878 TaxID=1169474 RepID=A0A0G4HTP3_9ALVE|mmetsp:Transcript_36655/g.72082  ORF Transcript_36655/g.72082 Transcript_36655/m.72082 type:complete len:142 (+) Transcript_36655:173-598(+)|eukprot:Cvel_1351.t1-p1 / transcript=Cvel_1351.t1 / gene=Cvel_1351 / organism=Chromera_velia_CCMP2878 / gene_product=FAD-linked sulfhydryl oxidase ALR, putative / transcript_product=FAD-linked sulfhydryl oxidase ALR, putative / location=Cvel_scaffold46:99760-102558(+) / protein_length=141 / sequence_SO=supercontig / SO=protein_coding / is_pseudo=false